MLNKNFRLSQVYQIVLIETNLNQCIIDPSLHSEKNNIVYIV